jgi:hypothetical protein
MPWLLVVGGQVQGSSYTSGMKEAAPAASFILHCFVAYDVTNKQTFLRPG